MATVGRLIEGITEPVKHEKVKHGTDRSSERKAESITACALLDFKLSSPVTRLDDYRPPQSTFAYCSLFYHCIRVSVSLFVLFNRVGSLRGSPAGHRVRRPLALTSPSQVPLNQCTSLTCTKIDRLRSVTAVITK